MPPKIQFSKADLLHAAFSLTRSRGLEALNARSIARELGCSTQPIFRAFRSMEEIRGEMARMSMDVYANYISRSATLAPQHYLGTGLAYILFAQEEPQLFRILFMCDRTAEGVTTQNPDKTLDFVLELVMKGTGLSRERAEELHRHLWIYAHGLASMVVTRFITLTREEIVQLLRDEYRAICLLFGLTTAEKQPQSDR